MTLEVFSVLLSIGLFAIAGALILALTLFFIHPKVRALILAQRYERYMAKIAIIGVASIVGALIYQLFYLTPVCELCWWQRIFLFPTAIIAVVAFFSRGRDAHRSIGILSLLGLFYALYHYYYHFQGLVLGNALSLPCTSGGLLPACTDSPILTFGFVTIPFMGILVFMSLLILCFFAGKRAQAERV